jgi:hypothetical protein
MAGILYLAIPELRDPALLAHHVITAALSVLGLHPVVRIPYREGCHIWEADAERAPSLCCSLWLHTNARIYLLYMYAPTLN